MICSIDQAASSSWSVVYSMSRSFESGEHGVPPPAWNCRRSSSATAGQLLTRMRPSVFGVVGRRGGRIAHACRLEHDREVGAALLRCSRYGRAGRDAGRRVAAGNRDGRGKAQQPAVVAAVERLRIDRHPALRIRDDVVVRWGPPGCRAAGERRRIRRRSAVAHAHGLQRRLQPGAVGVPGDVSAADEHLADERAGDRGARASLHVQEAVLHGLGRVGRVTFRAVAPERKAVEEAEPGATVPALHLVREPRAGIDVGGDAEVPHVREPRVVVDRRADEPAEAAPVAVADPMTDLDAVPLELQFLHDRREPVGIPHETTSTSSASTPGCLSRTCCARANPSASFTGSAIRSIGNTRHSGRQTRMQCQLLYHSQTR